MRGGTDEILCPGNAEVRLPGLICLTILKGKLHGLSSFADIPIFLVGFHTNTKSSMFRLCVFVLLNKRSVYSMYLLVFSVTAKYAFSMISSIIWVY